MWHLRLVVWQLAQDVILGPQTWELNFVSHEIRENLDLELPTDCVSVLRGTRD